MSKKPVSLYRGLRGSHRQEVRSRILVEGLDDFTDLELLECLLFFALHRRNAKIVAQKLLRRYGSFANVIAELSKEPFLIIDQTQANLSIMRVVKVAAARLARGSVRALRPLNTCESIETYLTDNILRYDSGSEARFLFLDSGKVLIADKCVTFTLDTHLMIAADLLKVAVLSKASFIILVRNMTDADSATFETLAQVERWMISACRALAITFVEHRPNQPALNY